MSEYKDTLNLPQTDFSMKANLSQQEPKCLAWWEEKQIYKKIRQMQQGKPKFVLHDGPPYANGHLHCGHALNKILKDMVIKSKTLAGFDAPFIPGWDCHGLPIELNVEKKFGKPGEKLDAGQFRTKCREYAQSQINIQRAEFKRLGVFGEWEQPYATMDYTYEAEVVRVLGKLIDSGLVYQGFKPVHWCVACGSALAEAEVDYEDKQSPSIDVAFEVVDVADCLGRFGLEKISKRMIVPIWTTTPWTLPANEAVCLHPSIDYVLYDTPEYALIVANPLAEDVLARYGISTATKLGEAKGETLSGLHCRHPFLDKQVPIILGEHVTTDTGTGCVHTAPAHGVEDHEAGKANQLSYENIVLSNGCYAKDVPFFGGMFVLKANEPVIEKCRETHTLLANQLLSHSYPHCWRHKTPMIFLATPQWFISMDKTQLRASLLKTLEEIHFIPDWGRVRMANMISSRPDWCISRQRTWGSPIPVLIHKETRVPHPQTSKLIQQVAALIEEKGVEAWFALDIETLIGPDAANYEKVMDTLDVWFDAGVSHACVLKKRSELTFPADLYLEGSDQYRGWFNSSFTTAVALESVSPYRTVLTHGYTVDAAGKKLSKSQGNYVELEQVMHQYGADLLRLWVASTDYRHEVSISDEILKRLADAYRRMRNTARFLLANLFDFDATTQLVPVERLIELDRYILAKAQLLQNEVIQAYQDYHFHVVYQKIHHFCSIDLGSFYLDIIKDRQYTTGKNSLPRRSCQSVMYYLLQALTRWIAPFLSYTAEEIWKCIPADQEESVFLTAWYQDWPLVEGVAFADWEQLQVIRDEVNKALELAREAKVIGSGLAAEVCIYVEPDIMQLLSRLDDELRFFLITSKAQVLAFDSAPAETTYRSSELKLAVMVQASPFEKCVRCWHRVDDIGQEATHPELCVRCANTVNGLDEVRYHV